MPSLTAIFLPDCRRQSGVTEYTRKFTVLVVTAGVRYGEKNRIGPGQTGQTGRPREPGAVTVRCSLSASNRRTATYGGLPARSNLASATGPNHRRAFGNGDAGSIQLQMFGTAKQLDPVVDVNRTQLGVLLRVTKCCGETPARPQS